MTQWFCVKRFLHCFKILNYVVDLYSALMLQFDLDTLVAACSVSPLNIKIARFII